MSTQRIGGKEEESVYFERLSQHALKALITGLLGSSLNHPNKSFTGDIVDFELPTQSSLPSDFSISEEDEMIRSIRQGKWISILIQLLNSKKRLGSRFSHLDYRRDAKERRIIIQSGLVNESTFAVKRHKSAIAEAFQACFPFAGPEGHILTMPNGEKIQFKESENSTTEDLNLLSMNAINMMAAELLKFKPLIFFTDDKQGYPVVNNFVGQRN